ncbi:cobyric acid synthase [Pseudooceanicola sediminis]|uniref:Cobyric acid synthase n=1 Tax=Pseudooceanicola sediminis TaxID=2211117 RepID=A0A399J697_9RHOB|nr:cobyric acid synthase [Pseudooceanicola sediminis]KAA2311460.1 cobyric acid synthase [Puniceibacterium sp. HSS470]RII40067.1 cobyric acid synthase [Pseudooceanicola sediminis]|tara:strand:- start:7026 stop:8489 length:1464 start_codon:yes stop_codon:yes gene_type:complete
MARAIMMQGTGSNVGKSLLVAGMARAFANRGLSVAPFKPQNMSNNAAVTPDGGEIGRAQALQALACRRAPSIHMNPVLLKPESDIGSQVIVQGQRVTSTSARDYALLKPRLLSAVLDSFRRISATADLVIVEGAGSPAEVNLRAGDIANMGFAEAAQIPVLLIGDIDRGGVIAQIVGTHTVLSARDNARIHGFAVNKFRGDPRLFDDGVSAIAAHTGWQPLGVLPWFADAWRLPAEDIMDLDTRSHRRDGALKIAVPRLGRIANFDDLDPLAAEPGITLDIIPPGRPLPGDATLVLIPGSKSTIADLEMFRANGWDIDLAAHVRRGGHVLGLCGGYQMLGRGVSDPDGIEGRPGRTQGLGLLDVETVMKPGKRLALSQAHHLASGAPLSGYEIHLGETTGPDCARAWLTLGARPEGAASADGLVRGCYLHGLFSSDAFRAAYLAELGGASQPGYDAMVEKTLDALAAHIENHMNLDQVLDLAQDVHP